jgi:hypothetical protein
MEPRKHLPVMLGEHWMYVLAGVISITTLVLLHAHDAPISWSRWW